MRRPFVATILRNVRHSSGRLQRLHSKVDVVDLEATSIFSARKMALARFADAASITLESAPTGVPASGEL